MLGWPCLGGIPLEPKLQVLVTVITNLGPYQVVNQMLSINSRVWKLILTTNKLGGKVDSNPQKILLINVSFTPKELLSSMDTKGKPFFYLSTPQSFLGATQIEGISWKAISNIGRCMIFEP